MITSTISDVDVNSVLDRLKREFDITSNRALSDALGMSNAGVAAALSKNTLPIIPIVNTCLSKGINLQYIFTGEIPEVRQVKQVAKSSELTKDDLLRAAEIVDRVLEKVFNKMAVPVERQFSVYKTLRPVLTNAVFEHSFNEKLVYIIAKSALSLT